MEMRKTTPFSIASKQKLKQNKTKKTLGINLMKEVKDLYNENYRTLKKEIKEDLRIMERSTLLLDRQN